MAKTRIHDALAALSLIESRLKGISESQLAGDPILTDACCYRICVVGEAISFAKEHQPSVFAGTPVDGTTWDALIEIRNGFIHQYNQATAKAVWMYFKGSGKVRLGLANVLGKL